MRGRAAEQPFSYALLKARMLCLGVQIADHAKPEIDPTFIHGAVFSLPHSGIVNTSCWNWPPLQDPIPRAELGVPQIRQDVGGELWVADRECGQSPVHLLSLGNEVVGSLRALGTDSLFSLHSPSTLFCAPVRQCIYIAAGKPCRYCTFEGGKVSSLSEPLFSRSLEAILASQPAITSIALGGGTPQLSDMGCRYYSRLANAASTQGLGASVELVPPQDLSDLDLFRDTSSLIMSLEIWDESRRKEWCLGKGAVSRDHYFKAWDHALGLLGANSVASVLLVGAEPIESTLRGAEQLIARGVVPTLIPLRWYPTSRFDAWSPVDPQAYILLEREIAGRLRRAGLFADARPGCTACGGCSLELAFQDPSIRDSMAQK